MNKYIVLIVAFAFISCKSTAVLTEKKANTAAESDKIIESHYNNKKDFKTLYIKSSARYEDDKQMQNVSAEIRIKKDEIILVSIRFLGITMAKALITPTQVKYYEKLNSKYFEGDYTTLSKWLGTDLDFMKVQNMLVGQAMDDLSKGTYATSIEDSLYKLADTSDKATSKTFYFEAANFLIKKQEIMQQAKNRQLTVSYPAHTKNANVILPSEIVIDAIQKEDKTNIKIQYQTVTFDEGISFPYSVPDGYERLFIN